MLGQRRLYLVPLSARHSRKTNDSLDDRYASHHVYGLVVRKGRDVNGGYVEPMPVGRRSKNSTAAHRKVLPIAKRQSINRRRRYSPDSRIIPDIARANEYIYIYSASPFSFHFHPPTIANAVTVHQPLPPCHTPASHFRSEWDVKPKRQKRSPDSRRVVHGGWGTVEGERSTKRVNGARGVRSVLWHIKPLLHTARQ